MTAKAEALRNRLVHAVLSEREAYARALDWQAGSRTMERVRYGSHVRARATLMRRALVAYRAALPNMAIARCPFTDAVVRRTVDTYGLDGPYWDYQREVRPFEPCSGTLVAWTGSLQLNGTMPAAPFVRAPGPDVPYVVPGMFDDPRVHAVVARIKVGGLTGHVVSYFKKGMPPLALPPAVWGTRQCPRFLADGALVQDVEPDAGLAVDFDLARWIDEGRLSWVAPGDTDLRLHNKRDGCPYLGLEGSQERAIITPEGTRRAPFGPPRAKHEQQSSSSPS